MAQQLLRATNLPVQDIAAKVGFSGSSRFISLFREETGVTPGEYRNGRAGKQTADGGISND